MSKTPNAAESEVLRVTLSTRSVQLLQRLAVGGIYGRNAAEVAGRFVDERLREFVKQPRFSLAPRKGEKQ